MSAASIDLDNHLQEFGGLDVLPYVLETRGRKTGGQDAWHKLSSKSCLEKCGLSLRLKLPSCCQLRLLLLWADQKLLWTANSDNGIFCKDKLRRIFTPPPKFPCIAFKRYIAYLANMFQDVKFFGGKKYPVESLSWLWDRFCLCEHKDGYHTAHHFSDLTNQPGPPFQQIGMEMGPRILHIKPRLATYHNWVVLSNISFSPLLGEMIQFDVSHTFQLGWFKHQLVSEG